MGVGGQHHAPAALPPRKTRYPLYRRLGGPQGRSGRVRKISPPTGIRSLVRPARMNLLHRRRYPGPLTALGEEIIEGHQCRFRRYMSNTDHAHIFCIRRILDKKWEYNEPHFEGGRRLRVFENRVVRRIFWTSERRGNRGVEETT